MYNFYLPTPYYCGLQLGLYLLNLIRWILIIEIQMHLYSLVGLDFANRKNEDPYYKGNILWR